MSFLGSTSNCKVWTEDRLFGGESNMFICAYQTFVVLSIFRTWVILSITGVQKERLDRKLLWGERQRTVHIVEIISENKIATSRMKKSENTTTSKKVELRKDEEVVHSHKHEWQALKGAVPKVSSTAELYVGREVLRAGLTSLKASFTISPWGNLDVL